MVNNSVLITDSGINKVSGGGIVSLNLAESLQECTNLRYILSTQKFPDNKYNNVEAFSINPNDYGYSGIDPFFIDYMAYHLLQKEPTELVVTYGCPFGLTIEEIKREFFCKVVCDLAPHNIDISREEHMKFTGQYPYPHLTDSMLWGLYSRHLRFADKVVVHSHSSAEYIKRKARLKEDPVVIPHGCYLPEDIPAFPEMFTPSYFGSVGLDKGITYLINAWLGIPQGELLIGGREGENLRLEDKYMSRFKILGLVENLVDFYKQTSIYIQPSIIEGFGLTPLEAMAHGRPVIVAEGAGMSELVTDGKDGFVVPIRDIDAIRNKIIFYHDNPDEITRMGAEARKTAEKYTWDIIKRQYIKLYEELL